MATLHAGFLSDAHARAITKALQVRQAGRLELAGLSSPPAPAVVAAIDPTPTFLSIVAAVVMGVTTAVVARDLARTRLPRWLQALALLGVIALPSVLFIATSSVAEAISIAVFVLAWRAYTRFARQRSAYHGFLAGLLFALAFGATVFAPFVVLPLAVAAPLYFDWRPAGRRPTLPQALTGVMVVLLPSVLAVVAWAYLNWLFTGDPLRFVRDPASPLYAFGDPGMVGIVGDNAVRATLTDVLRVPMFVVVGGLLARQRGWGRTATYLSPVLLILTMRSVGFGYAEHFSVATLAGFALVSLSNRDVDVGRGRSLLAAVVTTQAVLALLAFPPGTPELSEWRNRVVAGIEDPAARLEQTIGRHLATAEPRTVLIDDTSAFRLIARAGTIDPFIVPSSPFFGPAVSVPQGRVDHIVVATEPGPGPLRTFARRPPEGFVIAAEWPGWRLLSADDTPRLFRDRSDQVSAAPRNTNRPTTISPLVIAATNERR